MSNPTLKQECLRARVFGIRKDRGRVNVRLTTPVHVGTFLALANLAARKGAIMVAANTPRLDYVPHVNLARCFLHRAYDALQAGNLFEAGCLLRESVRRQLWAECCWKGCLPKDATDKTPARLLLAALRNAGFVGKFSFDITVDIINTGNKAAHCKPVSDRAMRSAISLWHNSIDNDPCGEPAERVAHCKPVTEGYDIDEWDDDDGSDWWKGAAV